MLFKREVDMLYPTLNQPLMFLLLVVVGFIGGVIFDIFNIITTMLGNDKYSHHFFNFLAVLVSFALLFIVNLKFNYGQFRLYVIAIFLAGFFLERVISKFLWTKLIKKCYSIFSRKKGAQDEQGERN